MLVNVVLTRMTVARVSALCIHSQSHLAFFPFVDAVHPELCGFTFTDLELAHFPQARQGKAQYVVCGLVIIAMIVTLHDVTGTLFMSYSSTTVLKDQRSVSSACRVRLTSCRP
jgi:hypothetical protein